MADPAPGIRFDTDMGRWLQRRKSVRRAFSMRQTRRPDNDLEQVRRVRRACQIYEFYYNYQILKDSPERS